MAPNWPRTHSHERLAQYTGQPTPAPDSVLAMRGGPWHKQCVNPHTSTSRRIHAVSNIKESRKIQLFAQSHSRVDARERSEATDAAVLGGRGGIGPGTWEWVEAVAEAEAQAEAQAAEAEADSEATRPKQRRARESSVNLSHL